MTKVRVGIVSWNTAALLDRCLASLPAALDGLDAEVVVVDNASGDRSAARAREHPGVRVEALAENLGYARAMNLALAGPPVDALVALNPDTEPAPGSLRTLVERLLADDRLGVVAPRLTDLDGTPQHSVHRFPSLGLAAAVNLLPVRLLQGRLGRRLWVEGVADHSARQVVDWAIGAVHVLRPEATGPAPYSERWFMYVEDLDLCWRLHRQGWLVSLEGDVAVAHAGNASGAQAWGASRTRRWLAATYDWAAAAHGGAWARAYAGLNLIGSLAKGTASLARGRARHDPGATAWGRELLGTVPVHARALLVPHRVPGAGSPPPPTPRKP